MTICAGLGQCVTSLIILNLYYTKNARKEDDAKRSEDETVLSVFCITNVKRVKSANINAFYRHGETRSVFFAEIYAMSAPPCTISYEILYH